MTWYQIKASANSTQPTEVLIYDEIGGWGISASQFVRDVQALGPGPINVRINSPGGSVFDGLAIYNFLASRPDVTITVDGLAASSASIIAMASPVRRMPEGAFLMVHNPWNVVAGNAEELRQQADLLDQFSLTLAGIYSKATGIARDAVKAMMDAETWIDGAAAKAGGWISDLIDAQPIKASLSKDRFTKTPEALIKAALPSDLLVEDCVSWTENGSEFYGEIVEVVRSGVLSVPDSGITVTASDVDPAALIQRYDQVTGTEAYVEGSALVGLNFSALTKVEGLNVLEASASDSPAPIVDEVAALKAEVEALRKEADDIKSQQRFAEAKSLVAAAVKDGRIKPDVADTWVEQVYASEKSAELLASLIPARFGATPVGTQFSERTAPKSLTEQCIEARKSQGTRS